MKRITKIILICAITMAGGATAFLPGIMFAQSAASDTAPTAALPRVAASVVTAPTVTAPTTAAATVAAPTVAAPMTASPSAAVPPVAAITAAYQSEELPTERPPLPPIRLEGWESGEEVIRHLGDKLPAVAMHYGKTADELRELFRHDRSLMADESGRLHFAEKAILASGSTLAVTGAHFPLDQTFFLHSRAGSKRKVHLNFKGMSMAGTGWTNYNENIFAPPYDTDGVPGTFSSTELAAIQNIWRTISEDYAPFDVDITTEPPTAEQMNRTSATDDTFGATVLITNSAAFPAMFRAFGGIANLGTFDRIYAANTAFGKYFGPNFGKVALVFQNNDFWRARTASHELGHLLGLWHDGTTTSEYYGGQGTGATSWGPIMGHSRNTLIQFSKGEYANANNKEDDYLVMQQHGVTFAKDDFGNTMATAAALIPTHANGVNEFTVKGVIETPTDIDMFKFDADVGTVTITANPFQISPNLDIRIKLLDARGKELAQSNPKGILAAAITYTLPANGTYYVSIEGAGEGDPAVSGYSKYGSIGRYSIVLVAPHHVATPIPPASLVKWMPCASEGGTCVFSGTRLVRYGSNGINKTLTETATVGCNNMVFGDPTPGVLKTCSYADDGSVPAVTWTPCAVEGGICTFAGTKQVEYGAKGIIVSKTATGSIACNNATFGDPISGVVKACCYRN